MAGIGQQTPTPSAIGYHILHRFTGIVRHGERFELQLADRKGRVAIYPPGSVWQATFTFQHHAAAWGQPDIATILGGEAHRTTGMVAVFVGNQERRHGDRLDTQTDQARGHLSKPEAAVQQDSCRAALHQPGIALAAAAQTGETHPMSI